MNKIILLFISIVCFTYNKSYSKILSWSINNPSNLQLIDMNGIIRSNNALIQDSNDTNNSIRVEDIIIDQTEQFSTVFVRFDKKNLSSFVRVKVLDMFTEEELLSLDFEEQQVQYITNQQLITKGVYLRIELHGNDIELRSLGMEINPISIVNDNNFIINKSILYTDKDNLEIAITLQEAAQMTLLIYNINGDMCKEITIGKIFNKGEYKFYIDPNELNYNSISDKIYFVWLQTKNLRSIPVELIKQFRVIPR